MVIVTVWWCKMKQKHAQKSHWNNKTKQRTSQQCDFVAQLVKKRVLVKSQQKAPAPEWENASSTCWSRGLCTQGMAADRARTIPTTRYCCRSSESGDCFHAWVCTTFLTHSQLNKCSRGKVNLDWHFSGGVWYALGFGCIYVCRLPGWIAACWTVTLTLYLALNDQKVLVSSWCYFIFDEGSLSVHSRGSGWNSEVS